MINSVHYPKFCMVNYVHYPKSCTVNCVHYSKSYMVNSVHYPKSCMMVSVHYPKSYMVKSVHYLKFQMVNFVHYPIWFQEESSEEGLYPKLYRIWHSLKLRHFYIGILFLFILKWDLTKLSKLALNLRSLPWPLEYYLMFLRQGLSYSGSDWPSLEL